MMTGSVLDILKQIQLKLETKFPYTKVSVKMTSAKWRPFCLILNVLKLQGSRRSGGRLWRLVKY